MRKKFWLGLTGAALMVLPVGLVKAATVATMTLETATETVEMGELFTVDIVVEANGEDIDTVRANLKFPVDLLTVETFTLGSDFPRSSPGNSIDNDTGVISQGGFTLADPITGTATFGTVTFKAESSGQAMIEVQNDSRIISAGEETINTSGLGELEITIIESEESAEGLSIITLQSSTHPNQNAWYTEKTSSFFWGSEPEGAITAYYTAFDQNPTTNPTERFGTATEKTIEEIEDGIWYFHLKGIQTDGGETEAVHFRIQVDTVPPNPIAPVVEPDQLNTEMETQILFGTTDDLSGIASYEISFNNGAFRPVESPLILGGLPAETYLVEVKALDKAGNATYGQTSFRVYPEEMFATPEGAKTVSQNTQRQLLIIFAFGILLIFAIIISLKKRKR